MKKTTLALFSGLLSISQMACAQSLPPKESAVKAARDVPVPSSYVKYDPIVIQQSSTSSGTFNSNLMFLADQIDRNAILDAKSKSTVLTSISSLGNLGESSELGRLIREHLIHELQLRQWSISDISLSKELLINASGEFALSRDTKRLRENITASNVVTGTYTNTPDGVMVNIRVLDMTTGQVLSTAQTRLMKDGFIASLLNQSKAAPLIKLTP